MKNLLLAISLIAVVALASAQTTTTIATLLRPAGSLPSTCIPYSVRSTSTGLAFCNAAGSGYTLSAGGSTQTLTGAGAVDGEAPVVGVPHALSNHNTTATFFAWVSASNTVSVRRCVISADGSDPAAATVSAKIVR